MLYTAMDKAQLEREESALLSAYDVFKARGLRLDMSRGKPETRQLDLSVGMLRSFDDGDFCSESGQDVRNYGEYRGIIEARRLFGEIFNLPSDQVLIGGNSSINMIHDALTRAFINGPLPGDTPWSKLPVVKFICPVPGYDWHFHMCDSFHIQMLPVNTDENGPDMDEVERLAQDPAVKGLICVPMYSNPSGTTFSDEVVKRLASMNTAAPDFRIIWDNAYCVHHLYEAPEKRDELLDVYAECKACGNEDRVLMFASTSKVTFAGSGICAMGASPKNIAYADSLIMYQLVCYDKMNQLRHTRFLPDKAAVDAHMKKQADILRPKFEFVISALDEQLGGTGLARYRAPNGGYFICFYTLPGCAKRTVELCKLAGVTLTPAGAPYPHGIDPNDDTIRIAPTLPPIEELRQVMELFPVAVKLASIEKLKEEVK